MEHATDHGFAGTVDLGKLASPEQHPGADAVVLQCKRLIGLDASQGVVAHANPPDPALPTTMRAAPQGPRAGRTHPEYLSFIFLER
jgi:hypothetical protein